MFKESIVAIITPFYEDGIDISALKKLISRQIEAQTKGIVICGTTGEGTLLSHQERTTLIQKSVEFAEKRISIIVGCSSSSTEEAISFSKEAETLGADAVLIMTPFYVKPSYEGILQHFSATHQAITLPIILYNHPGRSGIDLSIDLLEELFQLDRIVALKDSNTDLGRVRQLKKRIKKNITLLSGDDATTIDYLKEGGDGAISVTANLTPKKCQEVMRLWFSGEKKKAIALDETLHPLHEMCMLETNPQPVKYALYKMGLTKDIIKKPLLMPQEKNKKIIDSFLVKYNLTHETI